MNENRPGVRNSNPKGISLAGKKSAGEAQKKSIFKFKGNFRYVGTGIFCCKKMEIVTTRGQIMDRIFSNLSRPHALILKAWEQIGTRVTGFLYKVYIQKSKKNKRTKRNRKTCPTCPF